MAAMLPSWRLLLLALAAMLMQEWSKAADGGHRDAPHAATALIARAASTPHPRLLASDADISRVRALAAAHPLARRLFARLVEQESSSTADVDTGVVVGDGRSAASTIVDCALLWRLTGNATWASKGISTITSEANARTKWETEPQEFLDYGDLMHGLSIGYDWLYPAMTISERSSVARAINRSFSYYAEVAVASPETFSITMDNWNAVVNGAAAMAALAVASEFPCTANATLQLALAGLQRAMDTFGDDGSWPEGQVYTQYAAVTLAHVASALETATGSSTALSHRERLNKLPLFLLHQNAPTQHFFSWADTDMPPVTADSYGHSVLMHLAYRESNAAYSFAARQLAVSYNSSLDPHWLRFFNELLFFSATGSQADLDALPTDALFPAHDIAMFRSAWRHNASFLGIKAGINPNPAFSRFLNNSYGHSHLDQGSFVLESGGQRFADDLGSDSYELPGYFGSGRFDYYRLNSFGHNVLIVSNQSQQFGTRAPISLWDASSCCRSADGLHCKCAIVDMSDSYAGVKVKRGFGVVRSQASLDTTHFVITDEITGGGDRWLAPVLDHCLGGAPTLEEMRNVTISQCKMHCEALSGCHGISYSQSESRCNVESGAVVVPNAPWEAFQFVRALPTKRQSFVWRMHTHAEATPTVNVDGSSSVDLVASTVQLRLFVAPPPMTQCEDTGVHKFIVEPVVLPAGRKPTLGLKRVLLRATGNCSRITVVATASGAKLEDIVLNPLVDWPDKGVINTQPGVYKT